MKPTCPARNRVTAADGSVQRVPERVDLAGIRVERAAKDGKQRGLAATRGTDEQQHLTRERGKIDLLEHGRNLVAVAEGFSTPRNCTATVGSGQCALMSGKQSPVPSAKHA